MNILGVRNKAAHMKFCLLLCDSLLQQALSLYTVSKVLIIFLPATSLSQRQTDCYHRPPSPFTLTNMTQKPHLKRTLSRAFPHPPPVADASDSQGC